MDARIKEYFSHLNYNFKEIIYPKGTIIISPLKKNNKILFILEGDIRLYAINEEGGLFPVATSSGFNMLGDMEFASNHYTTFYVEAKSDVKGVYLDLETERKKLSKDVIFLNHVIKNLADKVNAYSNIKTFNPTVEERVLAYLKVHHSFSGIDSLCSILQCSKRQLLRVLKNLCDQGIIVKEKRGVYSLR